MLTKFHLKPNEEMKENIIHCLKNVIDLDDLLNQNGLHLKKKRLSIVGKLSFSKSEKVHNKIDKFIIKNRMNKKILSQMRASNAKLDLQH